MGVPSNTPDPINPPKFAFKSWTFLINGFIFSLTAVVTIIDLITGANILVPIVSVFTHDPDRIALIINGVTQIYSLANILLRLRTTQPITFTK